VGFPFLFALEVKLLHLRPSPSPWLAQRGFSGERQKQGRLRPGATASVFFGGSRLTRAGAAPLATQPDNSGAPAPVSRRAAPASAIVTRTGGDGSQGQGRSLAPGAQRLERGPSR
jgi:hypothetical protein